MIFFIFFFTAAVSFASIMTVPWVLAYILPSVYYTRVFTLWYELLYLLSLAAFLWLPLSPPSLPPSSTPINIATVEAAKAKGTHGCVPQISCLFVFVCVVHPLNTTPTLKVSPQFLNITEYCIPVLFLLYWRLLLHHQCLFNHCNSSLSRTRHS